ncbi:SAM-dependent methyltransferase [candidate division KSB1 bacterium]|nr:MAG: SAM-dependent methyltransferase [candidate division KSB1 bacterium]
MVNVRDYNRAAWNREVTRGNRWTIPVSSSVIAAARQGQWEIILTPSKPVPRSWFPELRDCNLLCLASGGGQQAPILAAAGARVTVLDNSPEQLRQDRFVAERDGLPLTLVEGDMADLSRFGNESFDLIVHPCSNMFVPEVLPVWREAFRVLRRGGALLSGFVNPIFYIFDQDLQFEQEILQVKNTIPYSDLTSESEEDRQRYLAKGEPLEFGHSLEDQIGGQLQAGFVITGFFEDKWEAWLLSKHISTFINTRAIKP